MSDIFAQIDFEDLVSYIKVIHDRNKNLEHYIDTHFIRYVLSRHYVYIEYDDHKSQINEICKALLIACEEKP